MNAAAPTHPPEIEALGSLASVEAMAAALREIASSYGQVVSVTAIPAASEEDDGTCAFLVAFATAQDAMAASEKWRSQHFGITHVIVSVRRIGQRRPLRAPPREDRVT